MAQTVQLQKELVDAIYATQAYIGAVDDYGNARKALREATKDYTDKIKAEKIPSLIRTLIQNPTPATADKVKAGQKRVEEIEKDREKDEKVKLARKQVGDQRKRVKETFDEMVSTNKKAVKFLSR